MTALVHNTGVVFDALSGRDHQLEGLIVNGERTFHAAAEGSQAFAEAFRALPAFEHNSQRRAERTRHASPRSPTRSSTSSVPPSASSRRLTAQTKTFAPPFNSFLTALGPLTKAAKVGLPACREASST